MQLLQRGGADAAARHIQDAFESEIVGRLVDEPQIGERVADFLTLVKARPADDPVRQRQRYEPLLEFARLKGGANQDGDLVERLPPPLQRLDLVTDPVRLRHGVPQCPDHDLVAFAGIGP